MSVDNPTDRNCSNILMQFYNHSNLGFAGKGFGYIPYDIISIFDDQGLRKKFQKSLLSRVDDHHAALVSKVDKHLTAFKSETIFLTCDGKTSLI